MTEFKKPSTPQEALAHYGKKGMRWGVSNIAARGRRAGARIEADDKAILNARLAHPVLKRQYKSAKEQYRADKKEVGRKEAKKILAPIKNTFYKNLNRSLDNTSNEDLQMAIANALDSYGDRQSRRASA